MKVVNSLGLALLIFLLIALSFPVESLGVPIDRSIGDEIGYCECTCVSNRLNELCLGLSLDRQDGDVAYLEGNCENWLKVYPQSSIGFCERKNGDRCNGLIDTPFGWEQRPTGRYVCDWWET